MLTYTSGFCLFLYNKLVLDIVTTPQMIFTVCTSMLRWRVTRINDIHDFASSYTLLTLGLRAADLQYAGSLSIDVHRL